MARDDGGWPLCVEDIEGHLAAMTSQFGYTKEQVADMYHWTVEQLDDLLATPRTPYRPDRHRAYQNQPRNN